MRRSGAIAVFLTFLVLFLTMVAAVVFMFQGQQTLRQRGGRLENDLAAQSEANRLLEGQLVEEQTARLDGEATREALAAELDSSQAMAESLETEAAALEEELAGETAELEAAQELLRLQAEQPPHVVIASPENEAVLPPKLPVELVVAASDPAGVAALNLSVNNEAIAAHTLEDEPLVMIRESWTPANEGVYIISAMAVNSAGRASDPITITLTVVDLVAQNNELRAGVEANVIELRGLEPLSPITPTLLTSEELALRVEEDFFADLEKAEARDDALVLSAFDFIPPDFDLYDFTIELYSEAISGFYDPETAEFVVVSDDDTLDANEQLTHAHEFVHALQDQYYQLELLGSVTLDSEAATALRALAEGDATLVQLIYLNSNFFNPAQLAEIFETMGEAETDILDNAPAVLRDGFIFPYNEGVAFVQALYEQGEFEAVNDAWENLPQSTEHILHPDRYLAGDAPQIVSLAPLTATLGTGWRQLDEDIFGEFYLRQYLDQELAPSDVDTATTGWGGDRYAVYWNDEQQALVMVLRLVWDSLPDSVEFDLAYREYAAGLSGSQGEAQPDGSHCWQIAEPMDFICLYPSPDGTLIVRAPDLTAAAAAAAAQR